jgi:hypothetical protein
MEYKIFNLTWENRAYLTAYLYWLFLKNSRPIGRPRTRWQEDVLKDIKTMKIRSWTELMKGRKKWSEIVEKTKTQKKKKKKKKNIVFANE